MKQKIGMLFLSCLIGSRLVDGQERNTWHFMGGSLEVSRGWLDWQRNDVDGRYCLFSGHSSTSARNDVWCYDAEANDWEAVYPGDRSATEPIGGDLHSWGWDHVAKEYLLFDSGKTGPRAFAFSPVSRAWRGLDDNDFPGLENRTFISGSGTATSPDHDLLVITHGGSGPTKVVRFFDLRNRAYFEVDSLSNPPRRTLIQNQFLYISSIRKFLLFGGWDGRNYLNDLWLLDPTSRGWMPIAQIDPPSGVRNAHMAYDSEQEVVYLVGGDNGSPAVSILHLDNFRWEHLSLPDGSPLVDYPPRRRHGGAMFHPEAGFCTVAGVLVGASWTETRRTWCFKHAIVMDEVPPTEPPAGGRSFFPSSLGDLEVTWQASPDEAVDVVRYEVERSEDGGVSWVDRVTVLATGAVSYTHTYGGVSDGPARVRAVDASGNRSEFLEVF